MAELHAGVGGAGSRATSDIRISRRVLAAVARFTKASRESLPNTGSLGVGSDDPAVSKAGEGHADQDDLVAIAHVDHHVRARLGDGARGIALELQPVARGKAEVGDPVDPGAGGGVEEVRARAAADGVVPPVAPDPSFP